MELNYTLPPSWRLKHLWPTLDLKELSQKRNPNRAEVHWPQPPTLHPAQKAIIAGRKRYNVIDCGVRFGKTTLCQWLVYEPLQRGLPVAWYAPTYKVLEEVWRTTRGLFYGIATRMSDQMHRLEFSNGGVLEMWSLDDKDASSGRKYARVVIDEAAMIGHLAYSWEHVISNRILDYHGDAYFPSTPAGMNFFYTLYQRGVDGVDDWASFKFPTSANPYIDPVEIEKKRKELSDRTFRQLYLGEFIPDGSYFQNIEACCTLEAPDTPADHPGHTFGLGIDWGQSNDFTVGTVGCRECDRAVDWFRFNGLSYPVQRERIIDYLKKWSPCRVLPERNSIGQPNIDDLRQITWDNGKQFVQMALGPDGGYGFQTTAITKPMLIEQLYLALQRGRKYPKEYADEFRAYEVETRANGAPSFSAPSGQHDDCVISASLENYLAMSAF